MTTTLSADRIDAENLTDWVLVVRALEARYATNGYATGLELVRRIGEAAEAADHHPDLTLTWPAVLVRLWSHDSYGVTARDIALARTISEIAADLGVSATPATTQNLELCLDVADIERAGPFWAAVLGFEWDAEHLEAVDPDGRLPATWFQRTEARDTNRDATSEPRQRWHLDIHVDPAVADARIAAALAAGGTLVSDSAAPSFTVLADPEGNKVCVCTWQSPETAA
jgi:4a-hydroxytetrahydrobiopterin dehydratase